MKRIIEISRINRIARERISNIGKLLSLVWIAAVPAVRLCHWVQMPLL